MSPFWGQLARDDRLVDLLARESFDFVVLWTRHYAVDDSLWDSTVEGLKAVTGSVAASGATTVLAMSYTSVKDLGRLDHVEARFGELQEELKGLRIGGLPVPVRYVPFGRFWGDGVAEFGVDAWYADPVHGTALAQYATGCLWFAFLLDLDPRGNPYARLSVSPTASQLDSDTVAPAEAVTWIQNRVWELYQGGR